MAYMGITGSYEAPRTGLIGRLFAGWMAARAARTGGIDQTQKKLAGPVGRDAKDYLADLDIEVGF